MQRPPPYEVVKKLSVQASTRRELLRWVDNYLSVKEQRTHVRGVLSYWDRRASSVCQGSVLGPLSLLIYENDSPEGLESYLKMLADNAKILEEVRSVQVCLTAYKGT